MTAELAIVDAHMHLWDLARISYPWLTPPLPVGITGDVSAIAHDRSGQRLACPADELAARTPTAAASAAK